MLCRKFFIFLQDIYWSSQRILTWIVQSTNLSQTFRIAVQQLLRNSLWSHQFFKTNIYVWIDFWVPLNSVLFSVTTFFYISVFVSNKTAPKPSQNSLSYPQCEPWSQKAIILSNSCIYFRFEMWARMLFSFLVLLVRPLYFQSSLNGHQLKIYPNWIHGGNFS